MFSRTLLFAASLMLMHAQSGHWEGTISAPFGEVPIVIDLAKNANGQMAGTFSQPTQKVKGLPISTVTIAEKAVTLELSGGTLEGVVLDDGKTISGEFAPRGRVETVPFSLTRKGDAQIEAPPKSALIGKEMEGVWKGALAIDGGEYQVVLKMSNQPDGTSAGVMISVNEGLELPVAIVQKGANLNLDVKVTGGAYSGVLNAAGTELAGTYTTRGVATANTPPVAQALACVLLSVAGERLRYTLNMRAFFALFLALGTLFADGISRDDYRTRRAELRKSLDGVMVLFGAEESPDLHTGFFQDTNFLYLSGWREPGAVMMLTPKEEIFFLPERNLRAENFTGRKLGPEDGDAASRTGFDKVLPRFAIETHFLRLLETSKNVYTIPGDSQADKLKVFAPFHAMTPAGPTIASLRMNKSQAEISLIQKTTDVTVAAHLAAWKKMKPGVYEYEIASAMTNVYFENGCDRSAYAPIVGSGPNSVVLHYSSNHRRMDAGEVVVMDVGAECSDYATDVTRTVPAGGKFTARQREIYDIVLGAQKAAIDAIKPGARMRGEGLTLQKIAMDYINTHGKDLHGEPLGKYFVHGLGHHVGLDVHDPSDQNIALKAGMVITIEPGIYIPEENIGVRIEDTILVTENGSKILSGALPREPVEIEKLVAK